MEKAPAKYEPAATLIQRANAVIFSISVHVPMCALVTHYLLQVTFPEFQLSGQSFPVPLHGTLVSLLLRYQPFIVDDRIYGQVMPLLIKRQFLQVFIPRGHLCVYFTQFLREDESLHHALVHQCLFCWTVRDQLDALGLELILSENKQLFSYSALSNGIKKWGFYINSHTFTSRYKHAATDSFSMLSPCLKAGSW